MRFWAEKLVKRRTSSIQRLAQCWSPKQLMTSRRRRTNRFPLQSPFLSFRLCFMWRRDRFSQVPLDRVVAFGAGNRQHSGWVC